MPYLTEDEIRKMEAILENIKAVNAAGESPFVFLSRLKTLVKDSMTSIINKRGGKL
jgi:hypothetical protein